MKRNITVFSSILLIITLSLAVFSGCTANVSSEELLYNWLLENGELVDGTELVYKDNAYTLCTDHSKKMFVNYIIPVYNGYEVIVQLPLFVNSDEVTAEISVANEEGTSTLAYYHNLKEFTVKSPIEFGSFTHCPALINETGILLDDYGEWVYENGKYTFRFDDSKRDEYEQLVKQNNEIIMQRETREQIAKELSHKSILNILDWLKNEICTSAGIDISDLGYEYYK